MSAYKETWDTIRATLNEERISAKGRVPVQDTTFLPAALEVIERPVSPTGRVTSWALLAGFCALSAWLTFGRVDIVVTGDGELKPSANVQIVQPSEAGVIRQILVRDGQRVKKGQTLVVLDPAIIDAEIAQSQSALIGIELTAARSRAVLNALSGAGFSFAAPQGASAQDISDHIALGRAELARMRSEKSTQYSDYQAAAAAAIAARNDASKIAESMPLLDQQLAANESLLEKGYVSKLRVLEMRRQRLVAERDRQSAIQTAAQAAARVRSTQSGATGTIQTSRAALLENLVAAETEIRLRRAELAKANSRFELRKIVAPVDGVVAQLAIHSEGGVVEAAKPLMVVVPEKGPMIASVKLPSSELAHVRVGQNVAVKIDAYAYNRYGTVPGRVLTIGADAIEDPKLGRVFPVQIAVERKNAPNMTLINGMGVTADVVTGDRTLLSYLTSSIASATREAGRER